MTHAAPGTRVDPITDNSHCRRLSDATPCSSVHLVLLPYLVRMAAPRSALIMTMWALAVVVPAACADDNDRMSGGIPTERNPAAHRTYRRSVTRRPIRVGHSTAAQGGAREPRRD